MCGIAGILSAFGGDNIFAMTQALTHRGPDEEGHYRDEFIALGQRRLSIIDLSGGRQPMSNETDSLQLVCNGEIYNSPELRRELLGRGHQFKTNCDVEVILHLYEDYGRDCVKHLRGMFAFALWDKDRKCLLLARDHMGQKPLYFTRTANGLVFASEIKAIFASGLAEPKIDLNGLWHYISLRYLPDHYSLFANVEKLPAASTLIWQDGTIQVDRYWDLKFHEKLPGDEAETEEGLDQLLRDTIEMHLLSDVPVGAFLSGGIDSGTVSSIMATLSPEPIHSFSIGVHEQSFNELPFARLVAEKYGMRHHEEVVNTDILNLLPAMVHHMEEPADPFAVGVYLASSIASRHVKVVMGGDGGDENFAGYDRFAGQRIVDYYCLLPAWFRQSVMTRLIGAIPNTFSYKSLAQKAAWVHELSRFDPGERYAQSMSVLRFTSESKELLFTDGAKQKISDRNSLEKILDHFNANNASELIDRMLYTDLMTRIPDHLLLTVDRMSMAHSLEDRSPLLDYRLVEYAARIPGSLKLNNMKLKHILRKVAARYLPSELITREKQGFSFPIGIWLRTDLRSFVTNLFRESRFVELGVFERRYVDRLFQEHLEGRFEHSYRLWILLNLEIWYRLYFENNSIESAQETIERLSAA
ncbi:MAG: asparagine synthase (glutamine-hydrolyzing) [Kiloniellales bacterium]|nr:asparagine synthase (glutamine-hydrolyzing) [Kiloniellales bacterium]